MCDANSCIDKFLNDLTPCHVGQHAETCESLVNLHDYLEWGPEFFLQAACWLSALCSAKPSYHGGLAQEVCLGVQLKHIHAREYPAGWFTETDDGSAEAMGDSEGRKAKA